MINLLIVFAVGFGMYYLQKHLYRFMWDRKLTVDVRFIQADAFEGESVDFLENASNGKLFPLPFVNICYNLSTRLRQTDLNGNPAYYGRERNTTLTVPSRRAVTRRSKIYCTKRGFYEIKEAAVSSGDLFSCRTLKKQKEIGTGIGTRLTVYPREIELGDLEIPYRQLMGEMLARRFILPDPFEFTGVREYQPFDSFRQINFKAWAKTGTLMSNTYGYTVSQEALILLDTRSYIDYKREWVYEDAIRLAARFAGRFTDDGVPVGFVTNAPDCVTGMAARIGRGLSKQHFYSILEALARINLKKGLEAKEPPEPPMLTGNTSAVLISPYCDEKTIKWYNDTRMAGTPVLWIIPRNAGENDPLPEGAVLWESEDI